jgi:RHS repeat-associated protein
VTWGTTSQNLAIGASLTLNFQSECHTTLPNITGTPSVISKITLPNNTSYQFSYDSTYGLLDKITYPTGGYVSYTWGLNPLSEFASFETPGGTTLNGCHYHYDTPAVLHRYVSFDGVNIALQQDFTYSINWNGGDSTWLTKTTSVKTTDLVTGAIYTTVYTYAPFVAPRQPNDTNSFQPQIPVEQSIVYKNSAGTTQRTVNKTWYDQYELHTQQTALDNGLTSQTTYTYGPGAQVTEQDDYDFGSGAPGGLLRKTVTNYQAFNAIPLYPSAASIFDRPCQTIGYNGTGTTRVAETDYLYDGGATLCGTAGTPVVSSVSGLVANTHDETNYGSNSTKPRGNATAVTKQCFQGSVNCTNAAATYAYDETGQALSMTDACGNAACGDVTGTSHTTAYSYADSFTDTTAPGNTNAYLTQITHPITSGVSHIEKFSYAYSDGQLTVSTDQNNLQTQYLYNDPFRRITETDRPDGGQITVAYNDTALIVTTSKKINSTQTATTVAVSDGMGHVKQTQLTSDPQGTILTDTAYDGLGRVHTISNPHRSASSSTDGTTTYTYDALSRVTSVANPDGSAGTTSYSGNCATITDEAGKSRKSCSDGLGRMTSVSEDPTGQNIQTTYSYDALDNLTAVVQNGSRNRTFVYDSLSRLTSATNPESGAITYTYDANGNLSTRRDARNITTTYTYDALNRLTQESYSDGTPTATFQFDSGSFPGGAALQNAIGRLAIASTSNTMTAFGYDSLGRIKLRDICTPMNCGTGGWAFTYVYDLAGDLTQFNDGILPCNQLFGQTYDGAGRVTQVTSTWSDLTHPATLFTADATVGYYPNGALRKATLGNGLSMTNVYNNRLQPCLIDVNSSSATLQTCTDSTPAGNVLDLAMNYNAGVSDNGNVAGWNATGAQSFTRSYAYDSLNRLSTMADTATAQPCKGLSWTYDAWGNRTDQTVTAGSCGTFHAAVGTNNQLSGAPYQYDAGGNLIADGNHTYTYDAESRLTQVDAGATATYIYDAFGRRVKRTVGGNSYEYVYGKDGQLTWELLNGHINRTYIRSNGWLIAEYSEGTTYFLHPDHLGSTRLLTRLDQSIRECDDYAPFGEANPCGDNSGTTLKFTGKERDSESGLDDFGDRYYSSPMGRFTSVDPIWVKIDRLVDPQRLNLYAYGRNNPLLFTDPDGRDVTIGRCSIGSAQDCFKQLQAGLNKDDRDHVKLVTGDGKNGCDKGVSCVAVDADYKSDSKNFQVLQTLANDHSATATVDVLKPNDSFDLKTTISINVKTGDEKLGIMSTTPGFDGYTFFPYKKGDPGPFSPDDTTHSVINSEPSDGDIPATIHHEMRHIFLGDFGRTAKKAAHGQPGVDQQTKAAEDEAKKNEKQN